MKSNVVKMQVRIVFPYDLRTSYENKLDDAKYYYAKSGRYWVAFINNAGTLAHCIKANSDDCCMVRIGKLQLKDANATYIRKVITDKLLNLIGE